MLLKKKKVQITLSREQERKVHLSYNVYLRGGYAWQRKQTGIGIESEKSKACPKKNQILHSKSLARVSRNKDHAGGFVHKKQICKIMAASKVTESFDGINLIHQAFTQYCCQLNISLKP